MVSVVATGGLFHLGRASRADAPGSGLIRIDGYAAADREYSPPYGKAYPNHQGKVKRLPRKR
jgi:hypothetical protein